jgi:hypothetical protein
MFGSCMQPTFLDSPLVGLGVMQCSVDELRGQLGASRRWWTLRLKRSPLCSCGDLFDGDWRTTTPGSSLPSGWLGKDSGSACLSSRETTMPRPVHEVAQDPGNVHRFSTSRAETTDFPSCRWPSMDAARDEGGHRDLSGNVPGGVPGWFSIELLHQPGRASGHATYAPCSLNELLANRYDYWASGTSRREVVHEDP